MSLRRETQDFCRLIGFPITTKTRLQDLISIQEISILFERLPAQIENLLCYTPNLSSLTLINSQIQKIRTNQLNQLVYLNLQHNLITSLEGVGGSRALKELYVCHNLLDAYLGRAELRNLKKLEVFYLSNNTISSLRDIDTLRSLKELNVACNLIERIDYEADFKRCGGSLEILNLAKNRITAFEDCLDLRKLPNLKELNLYDPDHGGNPVCSLCNYRVAVYHYFSALNILDGVVLDKDMVAAAGDVWGRKKK